MAFLVKSLQNTIKAVDNTVKQSTSDTANLLYGQPAPEQKAYDRIDPDKQLMKKKKVNLMFQFGGSLRSGHWMVFIYEQHAQLCTKCHYTMAGVSVAAKQMRQNTKWKEHHLQSRTYTDIIQWCAGYHDNNAKYNVLEANCRKFSIRLAEYCNIPITEINCVASSQFYSVTETIKGTVDGTKNIAKGNVFQGVTDIGSSVLKNTAKIAVSTSKSIADTSNNIAKQTTDTAKAIANH